MRNEQLWTDIWTGWGTRRTPKDILVHYICKEHGCSPTSAEQVFVEYQKLVYLVAVADGPCAAPPILQDIWYEDVPSLHQNTEATDPDAMVRSSRFDPLGSRSDRGVYDATFALYVAEFGCDPPSRIWPSTDRMRARDVASGVAFLGLFVGLAGLGLGIGELELIGGIALWSGAVFTIVFGYWDWPPSSP
jgi:hypothetical protein